MTKKKTTKKKSKPAVRKTTKHPDDVQILGDINFATPAGMLRYLFGIDTKGYWRIGRVMDDEDKVIDNLNQKGINIDSSLHLPTTFLAIMMNEIAFDLELTFEGEEE